MARDQSEGQPKRGGVARFPDDRDDEEAYQEEGRGDALAGHLHCGLRSGGQFGDLDYLGEHSFAKGGQITINYALPDGFSSETGVTMDADDANSTIAPKGTGIMAG